MTAPLDQFRRALERRGIIPPAPIVIGKLARADVDGKRGKGDASYIYFDDGIPAGGFENHRDGAGWEKWRADIGRDLALVELEALRRRSEATKAGRDADTERRRTEARTRAAAIWDAAVPANAAHPYLIAKSIGALGLRQYGNALVVPVGDADGVLHSLQFIGPDGSKKFLRDGRVSGCYFMIGNPGDRVCVAEGCATAASIHEATGMPVAAAFDCGNLLPVAESLKRKYPAATFIFCADDDYRTDGNPGIAKAMDAARAVGGMVAVPDFGNARPDGATDFNDLMRHRGREAVRRALAHAMKPLGTEAQRVRPDALEDGFALGVGSNHGTVR